MSFSSLGLAAPLVRAAADAGYRTPTPIQAAAIPLILSGVDVLGSAQTGSGKTAAYLLPLLQTLLARPPGPRQVRALILLPTRELAAQVAASIAALATALPVAPKVALLFGGVSLNPQMMHLRGGADIVVATPGRLLDLIEHHALTLASVATLVLDEADRLLDLGFSDELARILAQLPAQRQNLFFSATLGPAVQALAGRMLHAPQRIAIAATDAGAPAITQRAIAVDLPRRTQLLKHLIEQHQWPRVLVFVATKYAAMHVADKLQRNGVAAGALHGAASQGARSQVLADFRTGHLRVLVATDVAARGIDVADLPAVINYDLPRSALDYIHRIGRTGRAGQAGMALSFVSAETQAHFRLIEKRQNLLLVRESIAGFEATPAGAEAADPATDALNGGVKGKRPSKKDKLRAAAKAVAEPSGAD